MFGKLCTIKGILKSVPHINIGRRLIKNAWFWMVKESRHDSSQITLGIRAVLG